MTKQSSDLTLLIMGDSLTEGYGVDLELAFPRLLQNKLAEQGIACKVINAGSSGATSASGIRRLSWYAKTEPDYVILALGSNDGLRGVPVSDTKKNIEKMIQFCKNKNWKIILAGLKVPPNYGPEYAGEFEKIYPDLAKEYQLPLFEFLLEGVAGESGMNQSDGIHPNEKGHEKIAENMLHFLRRIPTSPFALGLKQPITKSSTEQALKSSQMKNNEMPQ